MRLIIIGSALLMLLVSCGYRNPLSSGEDLVVGQKPSRAEKQNSASAKIDPAELFTTISKAVQETQDYLGGMSVQDFQDADIQATIDTFPAVSEEALQKVVAHDAGLREIANKLQEAINNFHSFAKIHDFSKSPDCISQFHKIQGIVTSLDDNSRDKNSPDKTSTNNIGALNQEMLDGYLLAAQESVSQLHSLEMCLLLGNIQKAMEKLRLIKQDNLAATTACQEAVKQLEKRALAAQGAATGVDFTQATSGGQINLNKDQKIIFGKLVDAGEKVFTICPQTAINF